MIGLLRLAALGMLALAANPPTASDVLAMLDRLPAAEAGPWSKLPGFYGRKPDAPALAEAIAMAARDCGDCLGTSAWEVAALLAVTAAFESAAIVQVGESDRPCATPQRGRYCVGFVPWRGVRCVAGDWHDGRWHSFGPFQLAEENLDVACDPDRAAVRWVEMAVGARVACASNAPDEQLASLASGDCAHGRAKMRHRVVLARTISV